MVATENLWVALSALDCRGKVEVTENALGVTALGPGFGWGWSSLRTASEERGTVVLTRPMALGIPSAGRGDEQAYS